MYHLDLENAELPEDNNWKSMLRRHATISDNNESSSRLRFSDSVRFSCEEVVDVYNSSARAEDANFFSINPFMLARCPRSHRATDFSQLLQVWQERHREPQSIPKKSFPVRYYPIQYEEGFEPYILVSRAYVCGYDRRLSGYGRNKCLHIYHLHRLGVKFWVCADVCAVHIHHPPSQDRDLVLGTENNARDHTILDLIKARYNKSRGIISMSCSSWALDDDMKLHPSSEDLLRREDANEEKIFTDTPDMDTRQSRAPSSGRVCKGTSIAWWPDCIQSDLIGENGAYQMEIVVFSIDSIIML